MTKRAWLVLSLMALFVLAGCNLFSASEPAPPPEPIEDPGVYVFEDDFTDDEIGDPPSKWTLSDNVDEHGIVEVVADDGVPSGRALYYQAKEYGSQNILGVLSPYFGEMAEGATTVAIEYWFKYQEGSALYHYFTGRTGGNRMMFLAGNNRLQNRQKGESGNFSNPIADIQEGWNRIRAVVNREINQIVFYVNDMENPISGVFETLAPIDAWEDVRIRLVHETGSNQAVIGYYSGFKVWVVE